MVTVKAICKTDSQHLTGEERGAVQTSRVIFHKKQSIIRVLRDRILLRLVEYQDHKLQTESGFF